MGTHGRPRYDKLSVNDFEKTKIAADVSYTKPDTQFK